MAYKDPEKHRQKNRESYRRHSEKRREKMQELREKYKAEGKCASCGRLVPDGAKGAVTCINCVDRAIHYMSLKRGGW